MENLYHLATFSLSPMTFIRNAMATHLRIPLFIDAMPGIAKTTATCSHPNEKCYVMNWFIVALPKRTKRVWARKLFRECGCGIVSCVPGIYCVGWVSNFCSATPFECWKAQSDSRLKRPAGIAQRLYFGVNKEQLFSRMMRRLAHDL